MFKDAVGPTTQSRRRHRGLASGLMAVIVAATAALWTGSPTSPQAARRPSDIRFDIAGFDGVAASIVPEGRPVFARQTPPILRPDYTGNVEFEIVYAGSVPQLRVFRSSGAPPVYTFEEFPRVETGTIGGQTVSIFRPSWSMGEYLLRFGLTIDFDGSDGGATLTIAPSSVSLAANGFPTIGDLLAVRAMSVTVGNVPVVQIDATAQYSSHVVNLVSPALGESLDPIGAPKLFYSYFGDDYEQLAFVFREYPFFVNSSGAFHQVAKNEISGINNLLWDRSGDYGSGGRLEGLDMYLYRMDNAVSNHELSHQWGHYFDWQAIAGLQGWGIHSPLWADYESTLTVNAIISSNQRLRPLGGDQWEVVGAPPPTRIPPLQAYAMGLLDAAAVPPVDILEDQKRPRLNHGDRISGTTRRVTIDQIVAHHGPRVGPVVTSVRRATILLSRDTLATPEEMAYWTLMAQRLEDPHQTGMVAEDGIGSFRAISGVPLHTRVIPPAGGPILPGHTMLEPDVLDPRDLSGVVLDTAPRLDVPHVGHFRMQGRIVDPQLAGATSIGVQHGGGPTLSSIVGPDGHFSIAGSPGMAVGRYTQRIFVVMGDGLQRTIARVRNVRLFAGPRTPPPPVALSATASGASVSIQWSPDTGWPPTSYFLDVGSSPGASNIGTFQSVAPSLSASGVPDGRYYVRVRAGNEAGVSAPSSEAVLTVGCAPPESPTMLSGVVSGTSVTLTWQPSATSGASYTVIAGSSSGASNVAQAPVGTATSLTAPVPAGRYFVRVRAVTPCGGAESNEVELLVGLAQLPGAPGVLTHQLVGGNVSLVWQGTGGPVDGYVIEAGSQPTLSDLVAIRVGNVLSFSAADVPAGTYYVRVRAFNAAGEGSPSNEIAVHVP
jgi:hypothetical protein